MPRTPVGAAARRATAEVGHLPVELRQPVRAGETVRAHLQRAPARCERWGIGLEARRDSHRPGCEPAGAAARLASPSAIAAAPLHAGFPPNRIARTSRRLEYTYVSKPQGGSGGFEPLPRGHHGLTPEEVRSSQRERLLRAMLASVAERGYAATTVPQVVADARVSRNSFYALFQDKEGCFIALCDEEAADLVAVIREPAPPRTGSRPSGWAYAVICAGGRTARSSRALTSSSCPPPALAPWSSAMGPTSRFASSSVMSAHGRGRGTPASRPSGPDGAPAGHLHHRAARRRGPGGPRRAPHRARGRARRLHDPASLAPGGALRR